MTSLYSIFWSILFFRYYVDAHTSLFLKALISCIFFLISGYKQIDNSSRENFNDTCEICSPGTYGNHPSRLRCEDCRGGVVCLEGERAFLHSNTMAVLSILEPHIYIVFFFFLQEQLQIILVWMEQDSESRKPIHSYVLRDTTRRAVILNYIRALMEHIMTSLVLHI